MPANFVPVIVAGAAFVLVSRRGKNRRRKAKTKIKDQQMLPPAEEVEVEPAPVQPTPSDYGEVYDSREVDLIKAKVGERFTVALDAVRGTGYTWALNASPPDNSIEALDIENVDDPDIPEGVGGGGATEMHKFKAVKPGSGSLVFHYQRPWMKGKEPPQEILEVETEIS